MNQLWRSFLLLLVFGCLEGVFGAGTGWICDVGGKHYHEGDNFTTSLSGPCITYQCSSGIVKIVKSGCQSNGACRDIGESWSNQCLHFQCQEVKGTIGIKIVKGGCMVSGQCLDVDAVYRQGCFNYTCLESFQSSGPSYTLALRDWGCSYGDHCVPANYTETQNCITRRCEVRNKSVGLYNLNQACMTPDNRCVDVGTKFVTKCKTYLCKQQDFGGFKVYTLDMVAAACMDADGHCHAEGGAFNMRVNNELKHNCTCHTHGLAVHYSCGNH